MNLLKKIRSRSGETLIEALASILILVLSMTVLAAGMSAAGKVSSLIDLEGTSFSLSQNDQTPEAVVVLSSADGSNRTEYKMSGHMTVNEYYYYD